MSQTALTRFLCAALVIGAALLPASCGSGEQPTAPEPSPPAGGNERPVGAPRTAAPDSPEAPETIDWPDPPAQLPEGAPLIALAKTRHDFGAITDAGTYTGRFEFKNIGKGTLIIRDVKSACDCAVPRLDKREYLPGEVGTLEVVLDPSNRKEGFIKYLFMYSNSAANSGAKLSVTADILPLVRFESVFLRIGPLELGKEHERSFSGYYTDPELQFAQLKSDNPHLTVQLLRRSQQPQPGPDGRDEYRAVFKITIAKTAPWGVVDPGKLTLTARGGLRPGDDPREANYNLYVSSQIYGDLRPEPSALTIDAALRVGESFDASLVLSSASGASFSIIDAGLTEPSDQDIAVQVEPLDPTSYRISVHYIPSAKGPLEGKVRILTDVPGEEDITIPFFGYAK